MALFAILAMLCSSEYLIDNQHFLEPKLRAKRTLVHPGYSQAWTFFPFFALLIRCVVGVYVISPPIGSSAPPGIVMSEPRDDPEPEPVPALYGIVLVFCRCFELSPGFPEASAGDLDEDLRRRVGLEDACFLSETVEEPVGGVFVFIAVDWAASDNCD